MNLPHLAPLIFAKEVLFKNSERVEVKCEFDSVPTLAMCVEAAAQSCAAFEDGGSESLAFLTQCSEVHFLEKVEALSLLFSLHKEVEVAGYKKFFFEVYEPLTKKKVISGKLTLSLQKQAKQT